MLEVYKYVLEIASDRFDVFLPEGAQILTVQTQFDIPCLWALVNPDNKPIVRRFRLVGTGHSIEEDESELFYHGTSQLMGGKRVVHLFEVSI